MLQITNYAVRQRKDGSKFIALELSGGLEFLQNESTGAFFCRIKKCFIPSTLELKQAKLMVGQTLEGDIVRVPAEPYEYTNKKTGETTTLCYSYEYRPLGSIESIEETKAEVTA